MSEPRVVGDDQPPPEGLDGARLRTLFEWMVLLRTFDERAVALQRQGRIGNYPMFAGEEATQAGPLLALRDSDWVFPSYRQNAIGILRGLRPSTPLKYRRGLGGPDGFWDARRYRVAPVCIPIATHLPHAVGLAWAARTRGDDCVSLVWFGDGATSEGDFHEAMNFAAVFAAPTVFLCVNNQWAISTPYARQTATATIAEKAGAYGMPGVRVDGFDALACYEATRAAAARARAGGGPTLVEAYCYRLGPHATADDPSRYRDPAEARRWRARDPIPATAAYLRRAGVLDDAAEAAAHDRARAAIAAAVDELDAASPRGPEVLFDYVYASGRPASFDEAPSARGSSMTAPAPADGAPGRPTEGSA
ncbi:MAG TPA: thiamine pyrophosphate-dependent enzyme [Actinomycetota bacterium]|nr:thiamine pyrophosphate-dependent enzyme [Actinomycetota bacterium]